MQSAWQWRQALTLGSPGVVRLDLPPATLDASRPSLADLRLIVLRGRILLADPDLGTLFGHTSGAPVACRR